MADILVRPTQRLTKYGLLLGAIRKHVVDENDAESMDLMVCMPLSSDLYTCIYVCCVANEYCFFVYESNQVTDECFYMKSVGFLLVRASSRSFVYAICFYMTMSEVVTHIHAIHYTRGKSLHLLLCNWIRLEVFGLMCY